MSYVRTREMLLELRAAIEAMDLKMTRYSDGEWVTAYIVPAGPWHRILGLARNGEAVGIDDARPQR